MFQDTQTVVVCHLKAVDEHKSPDIDGDTAASQSEHFRQMGILEEEFSVEFVVLLVERTAGNEDSNGQEMEEI